MVVKMAAFEFRKSPPFIHNLSASQTDGNGLNSGSSNTYYVRNAR